jgi:hypothetical protein
MKKKFTLLVAAVALAGCAGNGGSFGRAMIPLGSAAGTYLVLSHPETYHYAQQPVRPPMQFPSRTQMSCYTIGNTINCRTL